MQSNAPVYSLADEQRSRAESAAWARFTAPSDAAELYTAWLALLATRIQRARAALLLTSEGQTASFGVAAVWPDPRRDLQYLSAVAQRALEKREGVVAAPGGEGPPAADGLAHVGYPIEVGGRLCGAVVFDIGPGPLADLQHALRDIHWGAAWLVDHFRQLELLEREAELARSSLFNETLATAMQHLQLHPSALAVANELAQRLRCDRVSVGFERTGQVLPLVMSNSAVFDPRSDLVRWVGEAMDEVLDLGVPVQVPVPADEPLGALAHVDSARRLGVQAMLSVPVRGQGQTIGVMTLERIAGPAFDETEARQIAALGVLLGPYWGLQRANERSAGARWLADARAAMREFSGPGSPGLKLAALVGALLIAVVALWQTDYRVAARTVVEGSTQIAAVAPFDGFVAEGLVRAGDTVRKGQPLARLDDRDLQLERSKWTAEREQLQRRYAVAQAQADRAAMGVLAAQVNQAGAQLALAEERLTRTSLVAPFDGVVVSGDLSQQIGSPLQTGQTLFEVAPLQGFRVMMQVDDRDIASLAVGQRGELVLSGLPDRKLAIGVKRITPVSTQQDGRNVFAVEAAIEGPAVAALRPGMQGIGKVVVGQRSLLWIWTHSFVDWLRLTLWSWTP
ncbi:efflux RND transporter periplasmic adaptor subunit [Roseateles violae]|uniref:Efflux RND transporter periplasmic adaptor subunit n=1 Tax=Roseateles violae TaxID=3058042 RepID=A0ABT8DY38_9BURK|nr:efflux RND transporter periplasmic adaptor subunit [Pelomonas sp. PFR6]MDN3922097.1 efflux RND transporter periplasmic adaptor subunit [Pelomonas sp. PFR6]